MRRAALLLSAMFAGLLSFYVYGFTCPEHLQVNGEAWKVVQSNNLEAGLFGLTLCETRTILIGASLSRVDESTVLWHESMHALTCMDSGDVHNFLYNNADDMHAGIEWAAPHQVSFLAENPRLAVFLVFHGRKLSHAETFYAGGDGGIPFPKKDDMKKDGN